MSQKEYLDYLTQVCVTQIAEEVGFSGGLRESALDTLSAAIQKTIEQIGDDASQNANAAGRTTVNYFDIAKVLSHSLDCDISSLCEFENNSDPLPTVIQLPPPDTSPQPSIILDAPIKTISDIVEESQRKPTSLMVGSSAAAIANAAGQTHKDMNTITEQQLIARKSIQRRRRGMSHIPLYCPDFPDEFTYQSTQVYYRPANKASASAASAAGIVAASAQESTQDSDGTNRDSEIADVLKTRKILISTPQVFVQGASAHSRAQHFGAMSLSGSVELSQSHDNTKSPTPTSTAVVSASAPAAASASASAAVTVSQMNGHSQSPPNKKRRLNSAEGSVEIRDNPYSDYQ